MVARFEQVVAWNAAAVMGLALVFVAAMVPLAVLAGESCCRHCGCDSGCGRVCRLVCETKEVEVTFWACCGEDICVPGPGCRGCLDCDSVEVEGPQDADCDCSGSFWKCLRWYKWSPGKARIKTRKKLYKKTVTREIPTYRWVVEEVCGACESGLAAVRVDRQATIPPPPAGVRVATGSRHAVPRRPATVR